jgi:hypothetical protein
VDVTEQACPRRMIRHSRPVRPLTLSEVDVRRSGKRWPNSQAESQAPRRHSIFALTGGCGGMAASGQAVSQLAWGAAITGKASRGTAPGKTEVTPAEARSDLIAPARRPPCVNGPGHPAA